MRIEQFDADYLPRLEPVIAAQRARTEVADPRLPHLGDSGSIVSWLAKQMEKLLATGYLVEHKGEPLAFLIAVPTKLAPDSFMSLFAPLHHAEMSFAVADPTFISKTLHQLYTAAAEAMIETDYRIHRTSVFAAERELLNLWAKLAFGQVSTHAAAGLTDLPQSAPAVDGLSIRQATRADAGFIRHVVLDFKGFHQHNHTNLKIGTSSRKSKLAWVSTAGRNSVECDSLCRTTTGMKKGCWLDSLPVR